MSEPSRAFSVFSVRLTPQEREALDRVALAEHRRPGDAVRQLIRRAAETLPAPTTEAQQR